MNVLFVLILLFLLLTFAVFRQAGLFQVTGIFINVMIFVLVLVLIDQGLPILLVTSAGFLTVAAITLFFINGVNAKTKVAFFCVTVFFLFCLLVLPLLIEGIGIQGFAHEELDELAMYDFDVPFDFSALTFAIILMSFSGAVADGSMAISTATYELLQADPTLSFQALRQSSFRIVSEVLSSTINTLLFAFMGSNLALIIWFQDVRESFATLINAKSFAAEVVICLVTGMAAVVILPITAICASWYFYRGKSDLEKK